MTHPAGGISRAEARKLLSARGAGLEELLARAREVRRARFGREVRFCAIINARSGRCPEKCAFCAQSKFFRTGAPRHALKPPGEILDAARRAEKDGAYAFSIVTSGRAVRARRDLCGIADALAMIRERTALVRCASLGELPPETLLRLKAAGLQCYHHNVETAPSFHARIVATHTFDDEVRAVRRAREAGLAVCCGGIFGMGESLDQRVELMFALKDIGPDHVPVNFLTPIPGTPLEAVRDLRPEDCLRTIAVMRLVMPGPSIIVCGGREFAMGRAQGRMFDAGATGAMIGDYLTTPGQAPVKDRIMVRRSGYRIAGGNP